MALVLSLGTSTGGSVASILPSGPDTSLQSQSLPVSAPSGGAAPIPFIGSPLPDTSLPPIGNAGGAAIGAPVRPFHPSDYPGMMFTDSDGTPLTAEQMANLVEFLGTDGKWYVNAQQGYNGIPGSVQVVPQPVVSVAGAPAQTGVIYTDPKQRYSLIVSSALQAPTDGTPWVFPGMPISTNGGGVVIPQASDAGNWLDNASGQIVPTSTVNEWLAATGSAAQANPGATALAIKNAAQASYAAPPAIIPAPVPPPPAVPLATPSFNVIAPTAPITAAAAGANDAGPSVVTQAPTLELTQAPIVAAQSGGVSFPPAAPAPAPSSGMLALLAALGIGAFVLVRHHG